MFDRGAGESDLDGALAVLRDAVDVLLAVDLSRFPGGEVLAALRGIESERRRLAAVDHAFISEIEARDVAGQNACRSVVSLLSQALRVDPGEAAARLRAAQELGPRRALSGAALPPIFPAVAAACAEGAISPSHAGIITTTVEQLPHDVQAEKDLEIERDLVEHARSFGPRELRVIARRLRDTYCQDGRLADDADRARNRHITVHQHADGTLSGRYCTDAVTGEALLTYFDATAQPVTAPDGAPEHRTPDQRRHDALRELLLTALRTGELPATGGITTTIILTMTKDQAEGTSTPGQGLVHTGHDALISVEDARTLLGDAQIHSVVLGALKRIDAYGDTHRIFTQNQRLAMTARDHGCSFPGCTTDPARCEAHHIENYQYGGRSTVDNGTLLCPYHHRTFQQLGWRCTMINGIPHWTPPAWIDPHQTPRRNQAHRPDITGPGP